MVNLYRADSVDARGGSGVSAHGSNVVKSHQSVATEHDIMAVVHHQLADRARPSTRSVRTP